ncbi:hypothetical protein [Rosenbergiella nectarea]|uniref:hypothetical protein n=1 Tax=Rosenbergiella nectarea TaxID=988801 RepID=UPI001F4DD920|nr:hypothetical protein [Rosenbergiella nectarea]
MNNRNIPRLYSVRPFFLSFTALLLLSVFTQMSYAESRPPVAERVIGYIGDLGVKVWTLRIGDRKAQEALVQIEDADHDWNLAIQKMKITRVNDALHYSVSQGNKRHVVLILKQNSGQLFLPNEPNAITLHYSDALSQSGDAQMFLNHYLANSK